MSINAASQTLIRPVRSDVGSNAPDFNDTNVAWGIIGSKGSSSYVLEIFTLDDSEPSDHSSVASGETVKVPIGSIWTCCGARVTNKQFMKTAASTWTLLPTSAAT